MKQDAPCFKILSLAPFTGDNPQPWEQPPRSVDRQSLDDAMASLDIRLWLPLDGQDCPAGGLEFHFDHLKGMHPDGLLTSHPFLVHANQARKFIDQARKDGLSPLRVMEGLHRWPDLPPIDIPAQPDQSKSIAPKTGDDTIDNLLSMVAMPDQRSQPAAKTETQPNPLQRVIQRILGALFVHPHFRRMEAAWRGLRLLLQQGSRQNNVSVELAAVHPETLEASLTALTPYLMDDLPSLILLDLELNNNALSMDRLAWATRWAANLMVPLVAWVSPSFFQISTWDEISTLPFIPHLLDEPQYAKLRNLNKGQDGRWVCLTCNGFLIRYPYGQDNRPRQIDFSESTPLWIPPVWALGTVIAQAVSATGRPAHFTAHERFRIQDLALNRETQSYPMGVEKLLDTNRRDQMIRAGITPLVAEKGGDTAFFPQATTLASTSLALQLLTSQVTQLVLWCKDNLPAETNPAVLETQLRLALQVFSEQSRPPGLADYTVIAGSPKSNGRIPLRISVLPSSAFLSSQTPIEMDLDW